MKALRELFEKLYIRFTTDFRHKFLVVNETDNLQEGQSSVHPIMEGMESVLDYLDQKIQQDKYIQVFGSRTRTLEMQGINFQGAQETPLARNLDILLITDQPLRDRIDQLARDIQERFEINMLMLNYSTSEIQQLLDANSPLVHKILFEQNQPDKNNKFLSQFYIHPKKRNLVRRAEGKLQKKLVPVWAELPNLFQCGKQPGEFRGGPYQGPALQTGHRTVLSWSIELLFWSYAL